MRLSTPRSKLGSKGYSFILSLSAVSILLSGAGCSQDSYILSAAERRPNKEDLEQGLITDEFSIKSNDKKVDILFVVDNSGSMGDEQQNLAASFASFIDNFTRRNLDFQVGVISTDTSSQGALLSSGANEKILTGNTLNVIAKFQQNIRLGTGGSGSEAGLLNLTNAFAPAQIQAGGVNQGFIRQDALLSIVVVSDEDESNVNVGGNAAGYIRSNEQPSRLRVRRPIQLTCGSLAMPLVRSRSLRPLPMESFRAKPAEHSLSFKTI
jgi:hypothetical protein